METPNGNEAGAGRSLGEALDVALARLRSDCEEPYLRVVDRASELGISCVLVVRLQGTIVVSGEIE